MEREKGEGGQVRVEKRGEMRKGELNVARDGGRERGEGGVKNGSYFLPGSKQGTS